MKKLLLIAFFALFTTVLAAQNSTILLEEHFDGATMPDGWTIMGGGTDIWSISETNNAGGSANEIAFFREPVFTGLSRLVSPAVDLTGISNLVFKFKHSFSNHGDTHTLGIATSSDDGATWHSAWSKNYNTMGQYSISELITTEDFGKDNVRFCIYYNGDTYDIDGWYFDDIEIERNNVGLAEEEAGTYSIFPNPANESVKITTDDNIETVAIYNNMGVLVDEINVDAKDVVINTAKYSNGMYFINMIQTNGMSSTKRLVIVH